MVLCFRVQISRSTQKPSGSNFRVYPKPFRFKFQGLPKNFYVIFQGLPENFQVPISGSTRKLSGSDFRVHGKAKASTWHCVCRCRSRAPWRSRWCRWQWPRRRACPSPPRPCCTSSSPSPLNYSNSPPPSPPSCSSSPPPSPLRYSSSSSGSSCPPIKGQRPWQSLRAGVGV